MTCLVAHEHALLMRMRNSGRHSRVIGEMAIATWRLPADLNRYVVTDDRYYTLDPSSVTDDYWVWTYYTTALRDTYGKWLVFGKKGQELDSLWHTIHPLVRSGKLGATAAKCSTNLSTGTAVDDGRGVICVYTTKEMRDEVGLKVREEVKQTIRYKSDEATGKGMYACRGYKHTTEKTLYWKK